jgi:hypothetical protein
MPMRTMRIPASLSVLSALLVTSAAHAQTPTQSGSEQPPGAADQTPPASAPGPAVEPTPAIPIPETPQKPEPSWFMRPPFVVTNGEGKAQWKLQIYGFAEFDVMNDSTRSFADGLNSNVVAHNDTQAGNNGRTQMTIRNSRLGVEIKAPEIGGIKASGRVEGDFFGYDPNPTGVATPAGAAAPPSEAGFFNNPTWRIRHAFVKLESEYVDLLAGQMYELLGWQNYFFGCSVGFLGMPNELFNRTQQVRLSHAFKSDAVDFEIAAGGFRPIQRDSTIPDGEAGMRLMINHWKGINTPGNGGTAAFPAALGVSGLVRRFKVDGFSTAAIPGSSTDTGWAVAGDLLLPIIPAKDSNDRGNALTLVAEGTMGSGYANEFTGMSAGANFGNVKLNNGNAFVPDIDNGLVAYDPSGNGVLHTIDWKSVFVGLQYYLPPNGRMIIALNASMSDSDNVQKLFPKAGGVFKNSKYADANIFFDTTPSSRLGISYQYSNQTFCDDTTAQNHRFEALALYFF